MPSIPSALRQAQLARYNRPALHPVATGYTALQRTRASRQPRVAARARLSLSVAARGLCCNVLRGVATGTLESGAKFDSATRFAFTVDAGEVAMHRDRLLVGLHRSVVAALHLWRW